MMRLISAFLFSSLIFSSLAFSQSNTEGGAGALSASHEAIQQVVNTDLEKVTQSTLNKIVREGNNALAEKGFVQEAQQYQNEWDKSYSDYFTSFQIYNLGDHQPMNAWLADYYKKLQSKLGDPILRTLHLEDINIMNYAIPVVFQPKGDKRNGDHWNGLEYDRHFVPFISVVSYWAAYVGCRVATKAHPALRRFCRVAAGAIENLVKTTVAPKLSKVVYSKVTGHPFEDLTAQLNAYDAKAADQVTSLANSSNY